MLSNAPASGSARSSGRSWASWSAIVAGRPWMRRREVLLAGVAQHDVQLRHRPDRRNGNEVVAPEAPDLALNTALLVRALQADRRELRA